MWHSGLWHVLRGKEGLVQVIQALYEHSSSAVFLNNQLGKLFQTTVGIRQGCLLSPVLFNLFLEKLYRRPFKTTIPPSPLDGDDLPTHVDGCQQNSLEEDIFCPQVPLTTAKVEGLR